MEDFRFVADKDESVSARKYFVVICYDIVNNKKRTKFVKYLEKFAIRVQKSVFESYLTGKQLKKLKEGTPKFLDTTVDNVRIYKITGNSDITSWGLTPLTDNEDTIII